MTPVMIQNTAAYLSLQYSGKQSGLPPPFILKGPEGTGKSWVVTKLQKAVESNRASGIVAVRVPMQLNPEGLVHNIQQYISFCKFQYLKRSTEISNMASDLKVVLLIENIDRLFNLGGRDRGFVLPTRAKGAGAAKFAQVQHASEFRSFLIENNRHIGLIATAGEDTSFMEDPDQPFFQFFNVLELRHLSEPEATLYFKDKLGDDHLQVSLVEFLSNFTSSWITNLTDGKISYLNLLAATVNEIAEEEGANSLKLEKLIETLLDLYFYKVVPNLELQIERLSYQEKHALDRIALLPDHFFSKDVEDISSNVSLVMGSLRSKGIIEQAVETGAVRYKMRSTCLKAYLRFQKMAPVTQVMNPTGQMTYVGS